PAGADTAEVGCGLHPKARGCGLTARALNLVLDYAFGEDGIEVMHWRAVVGNWPSRKAAWRGGCPVGGKGGGVCPLPRGAARAGGAGAGWCGPWRRAAPRGPRGPWRAGG